MPEEIEINNNSPIEYDEYGLRLIKQLPWGDPVAARKEIEERHQPINYGTILGHNDVLVMGELHHNSPVRQHLADRAAELKELGITHYLIEALPRQETLDAIQKLQNGQEVDTSNISFGPSKRIDNYAMTVKAMINEGITVMPIDLPEEVESRTYDVREAHLTKQVEHILDTNPGSKALVLIGGHHASRTHTEKPTSLVDRLHANKRKVINAVFTGGLNLEYPLPIIQAANSEGLGDKEFMLDMTGYNTMETNSFKYAQTDYILHLPQIISNNSI